MSVPIMISIPKFVPIKANSSALSPTLSNSSSQMDEDSLDEFLIRGKKRRLDHLTWEEKIQRKKQKNRVAAQTSRDRKKAKMEDMEVTVQQQTTQINALESKCDKLQTEKDEIYQKYLDLESRFEELKKRLDEREESKTSQNVASGIVGCVSNILGSAVSNTNPLQKGISEAQSTVRDSTSKNGEKVAALWKIIAICLLYRTCSKSSTFQSLKTLPKVSSPMSVQTWKLLMTHLQKEMPKMKAPQSECLNHWWGPHQNSWNPAKLVLDQVA